MCNKKDLVVATIVAGLVITVLALVVDSIVKTVLPYDVFALGGMRAKDDPLMMMFFLHGWVLAAAMTVVYVKLGQALKGKECKKGMHFGLLMWLVVNLPSSFLVFTSMDYPLGFHLSGLVASIIYMPAAGIAIAKIMKE